MLKYPDAVQEYVSKELSKGRCSGPFSKTDVERILRGPFVSSPLLVSASSQGPGLPEKLRVCRNLSKGDTKNGLPALNTFVDKDLFPTCFDFAYQVEEVIANVPDGTLACAFDLQSFHRTVPVHPLHKPYLVFESGGHFYIDHAHPFGLSTASSNAGQAGGALVRIWDLRLGKNGKTMRYEDDIPVFRFPSPLTHHDVLNLVDDLHAPWHPVKSGSEFTPSIVFIGFLWDIANWTVSLPEEKRIKYRHRVKDFLTQKTVSLHDVQRIHGTLVHISFVHRDGASRLPAISSLMHGYKNSFMLRHVSKVARTALEWWLTRLDDPSAHPAHPPPAPVARSRPLC
ncbi:hypothetical protein MIND_00987100 [Mycena indigotica]|uniref:Reverse transcriptase domain-containing protein n=1 Tax=Mycena indigotica TaxID=2126181 RepID=A0A8H6SDQ0_9AGAR|nr:uncharacterized protein MIND_00987100 [Mycena indigotica]KAF7297529.1 hypothetical protein MIND_00987100 [Mycena indigotica]